MNINEAAAIIAETLQLDPSQTARLEAHIGADVTANADEPLTMPGLMLNANERTDRRALDMPPVMLNVKADKMPASDALTIIARYAGLGHDHRKKLARMLDQKALAKLGAAIESVQAAFHDKPQIHAAGIHDAARHAGGGI